MAMPPQNIYNTYLFAGIAIYGHSDHRTDITIEFTFEKNIYNTYVFANIAKYGHSDHGTDITIEFASKIHSRTYITLVCLPVLPYMVTPIMEQTSPLNLHQKSAPEYI